MIPQETEGLRAEITAKITYRIDSCNAGRRTGTASLKNSDHAVLQ